MILRILVPLALLLLLPVWGIDRISLRRRFGRQARVLFALPNIVLLLALAGMAINESYTAAADVWKGRLLSFALCLIVPEVLTALLLLCSVPFNRIRPRLARGCRRAAWGVGAVMFALMVCGSTFGYRHIVVKPFDYADAEIPEAFDGYRIVQLSDLHLGTLRGHADVVRDIVDKVNAERPDLVVFTGDIVNYRADELDVFADELRRIRAKDGVVSVMGNHDYAQYFRWASSDDSLADIRHLQNVQRGMGWRLLLNENIVLRRGNDSLAVVGVENDGLPPFPALADLPKAQRGLREGCFKILLSHDPTHWRRSVVPDTDIRLTLSGHTHGMQFKLGGFSPASWFYPEWGGPYTEGRQTLYVSLGTGEVLIPFRVGAWPEVNVITLRRLRK